MGDSMLREMQLSMFPGFKFSPTDEELISYYLKKKIEGSDSCVEVIPEVDLCQFEPWDLPEKSVIQSDSEWFFFSARGRKYPNGLQSKRATESGYWKATGKERNVKSGANVIGTKRTLVFHKGRAPKGERTEWIMHEYCISGNLQDSLVVCRLRRNNEFRLNDNPRRASQNQSEENSNDQLCEDGNEQNGVFGGDKTLEGCNSSYNSQSLEPTESGSESNLNITNQLSGSESNLNITNQLSNNDVSSQHQQKECDDEEDCFAEIMNDDIIKLDEPSLSSVSHLPQDGIKSDQAIQKPESNVVPIQGTANRRIRLGRIRQGTRKKRFYRLKSSEGLKVGNEGFDKPVRTLSCMSVKWQVITMVSVFLTSLALFFFCLD